VPEWLKDPTVNRCREVGGSNPPVPTNLNKNKMVIAMEERIDSFRSMSIRFFKLPYSKKLEISRELKLLRTEDMNTSKTDFEMFKGVLERAKDQQLIPKLDEFIKVYENSTQTNKAS
jgi:GTPase-associated adaptor domain